MAVHFLYSAQATTPNKQKHKKEQAIKQILSLLTASALFVRHSAESAPVQEKKSLSDKNFLYVYVMPFSLYVYCVYL